MSKKSLKKFFCKTLHNFIIDIVSPLKIVGIEFGIFFVWLLFTVIAGLIGPIINFINNYYFNGCRFEKSIVHDTDMGTFYTFAVVLIASSIGLIFMKLISEEAKFRKVKLYFIAICIFPMLFGGIFYSSHTQKQEKQSTQQIQQSLCDDKNIDKSIESTKDIYELDGKQLFFFLLSLLIAVYAFCLQYISLFPEKFPRLMDNYTDNEDARINELREDSDNVNELNGVELDDRT